MRVENDLPAFAIDAHRHTIARQCVLRSEPFRRQQQTSDELALLGSLLLLSTLSRLVRDAENETSLMQDRLAWALRVAVFLYSGGWRRRLVMLLPIKFRRALIAKSLRFRHLFDATAYLNTHRDVAEAGVDPLAHYLHHGIHEGRSLGPGISGRPPDQH